MPKLQAKPLDAAKPPLTVWTGAKLALGTPSLIPYDMPDHNLLQRAKKGSALFLLKQNMSIAQQHLVRVCLQTKDVIKTSIKKRVCSEHQQVGASKKEVYALLPAFVQQAMKIAGFKFHTDTAPKNAATGSTGTTDGATTPKYVTLQAFLAFILEPYSDPTSGGKARSFVERVHKNGTTKNNAPGGRWKKQARGNSKNKNTSAAKKNVLTSSSNVNPANSQDLMTRYGMLSPASKQTFGVKFLKETTGVPAKGLSEKSSLAKQELKLTRVVSQHQEKEHHLQAIEEEKKRQLEEENVRLQAIEIEKQHQLEEETRRLQAIEEEKQRQLEEEKRRLQVIEIEKECLNEQQAAGSRPQPIPGASVEIRWELTNGTHSWYKAVVIGATKIKYDTDDKVVDYLFEADDENWRHVVSAVQNVEPAQPILPDLQNGLQNEWLAVCRQVEPTINSFQQVCIYYPHTTCFFCRVD